MNGISLPKKLLVKDEPKPEENLIGYILRLTELNGYETPTWILQLAKIQKYIARNFSFNFGNAVDVSFLSSLTNVDTDKLLDLQYKRVGSEETLKRYLLYGWPVSQPTLRLHRPKICPGCLRASNRVHKIWDFVLVTACPIHKCLLIDKCPRCNKHISWVRNGISNCRCSYDWRDYSPANVKASELEIACQIYRLCNLLGSKISQTKKSKNNPLQHLELPQFACAILFAASQYRNRVGSKGVPHIDTTGQIFALSMSNAEIHAILCQAFIVFENWPANYYEFLDWHRMNRSDPDRLTGLDRDFKGYKYALYKQLSSKTFDFMRIAFEEYLTSRWDGGYINMIQLESSGSQCSKYVTQEEAIKLLKTHYPVVRQLVEANKLKAIVRTRQNNRLVLIERAGVEELQRKIEETISLSETATLLNVSRNRVLELVKHDLLTPFSKQKSASPHQWKFNRKGVEALLDDIESKVAKQSSTDPCDVVAFLLVYRTLARFNIGTGQFIKDILDNKICPWGKTKNPGLQGFVFSKREIREYTKEKRIIERGAVYTPQELASFWAVNVNSIYFLVKKQLLPQQAGSNESFSDLLISAEDIKSFEFSFIFGSKIALELGVSPGYLAKKLIENGIHPVCLPKSGSGSKYIFLISDLKKVDLTEIVTRAKTKKIGEYKERKLVSVTEAAKILGIEVKTVYSLIAAGVMRPHQRPPDNGYKDSFFSEGTIKRYKGQVSDYIGLVSAKVAAEILGTNSSEFYKIYVHRGRITAIKSHSTRGHQFFRLADVNRLIELKNQTIGTAEAAKILNIYPTSINKMVDAGKLKVASGPGMDGFGHNRYLRSEVENLHLARINSKFKEKVGS